MKNLIIFLSLTLSLTLSVQAFSQSHNELIAKFAEDNVGQKVGDGVCNTLIIEAFKAIGIALSRNGDDSFFYYYGEGVNPDSVKEGDIVLFRYFDTKTEKEIGRHIGIVNLFVSNDNMLIANQNIGKNRRSSIVEISTIQSLENEEGDPSFRVETVFFRPF